MKKSAFVKVAALGATALLLAGCAANSEKKADTKPAENAKKLTGTLTGNGSSAQKEAETIWAAGFKTAQPNVTLNYTPTSSGEGRSNFQKGTALFAGSDGGFKTDEISKGGFELCKTTDLVEIPVYISPIAIAFNVEGVKELKLDAKTIAGIFAGKITKWNDTAIASQNKDAKLPDAAIVPIHRSKKSGTTGNFTDYLASAAADVWTYKKVEEWPAEIKGGEGAAETANVAELLKSTKNTIGYLDDSAAQGLTKVSVKVGDKYVPLSAQAAAAVMDSSEIESGRGAGDLVYKVNRKVEKGDVYPVVLVSYLIGCGEYKDPKNGELVKEFFKYAVSKEAQALAAKKAYSAPLSDAVSAKAAKAADAIK